MKAYLDAVYDGANNGAAEQRPINSNLHTLYMTNRCNLACTYCYEGLGDTFKYGGMAVNIPTPDELRKQIDNIIITDDDNIQSNILLFGGEPLMQWVNMKICLEYAVDKKENIHFGTVTNGVLFNKPKFLENFNNFFNNRPDIKQKFSLDISFDGKGNGERVYRSGKKSALDVIKAIEIISKLDYNWRIRYTIQKDNVYDFAEDILRLAKTFAPNRIITSIDSAMSEGITDEEHRALADVVDNQIDLLRDEWISKRLHVSVCEFFCDKCNGCHGQHKYYNYYTNKGLVRKKLANENAEPFNHFELDVDLNEGL
jgi:sulfatase maturation enzyme AslB (radical SAM superfamily)